MPKGQYRFRLEIDDFVHDQRYAQQREFDYRASNAVSLKEIGSPDRYAVRLFINDDLAFADTHHAADDVPF